MFIHDGILESITCGNTQVSASDLQRMVTKLKQRDPRINQTGYEQQLKVGLVMQKLIVNNPLQKFCNWSITLFVCT